ncbi:hypothetical protein PIB30_097081 [Stylosanthes scabra]|uniref:Uncharacterized protein n=1 Tax=Stylosanthes scabra TaxID=79078 RepID=A0ABU6WW62_9FABA|nr:hypothetical protein [Stylosanthes scabra]
MLRSNPNPDLLDFDSEIERTLRRARWHCAVTRSINYVALTSYRRGRAMGPCGRASVGRVHPEMLSGTHEVARGDSATIRCPVSHFLASSCEPFASNNFLSLSYGFLNL